MLVALVLKRLLICATVPVMVPDEVPELVTTAPLVIVPMSAKRVYLDRYAEPDKGWTDRDEQRWPVPFWHIDTGMAALLILLTVVDEGLGALYFGIVPEAVAHGLRVIDLSGAWRLKQAQHRAIYSFQDADAATAEELTAKAVYGLPELNGGCIAAAQLVANPGCYATSVILALAPLLKANLIDRERGIISDSKSGVSGAGKAPTSRTHFVSVADNLSAYSVFNHRHLGEMVEQLGLEDAELTFTPHLLPIPRGILSTIYVHLNRAMEPAEVEACLRDFYAGRHWVRVFATPKLPQLQFSLHTNYCDLGFCLAEDGRRLVLVSCVDNLLKGAAGQAVQNMNLMYGWEEREGLQ